MFLNKILKIPKIFNIFFPDSGHNGFDSNTSPLFTAYLCTQISHFSYVTYWYQFLHECAKFAVQDAYTIYKPRHEKTNNVFFEQVRHKPSRTGTEDAGLDAGDFGGRKYR